MLRLTTTTVLALSLVVSRGPAHETHFSATFSGADASASGFASLVLSEDHGSLSYTIDLDGLDLGGQSAATDDDVIGLHFHNAPSGSNGPIVFGLLGSPNKGGALDPSLTDDEDDLAIDALAGTITGVWEATDDPALTTSMLELLSAQSLYLNVHTNGFQGGAIRGQVVPEPSAVLLAISALVGAAWLRRRQ